MVTASVRKAAGAHGPCVHVAIAPGVCYCCTMATVFIEPNLTRHWLGDDKADPNKVFLAVAGACKELLPHKSVQAYSYVEPGTPVHGITFPTDLSSFRTLLEKGMANGKASEGTVKP